MDRFVQKSGRNVTAHQRHSEFKQWTHVSGGKLFCTACNVVINHERKSVVEKHRDSAKHRLKSEGEPPAKRQKTITSYNGVTSTSSAPNTISSEARNELCKDLVAVFAATNIPLSKLDHPQFRNFLHKHVVNGGAVPKSKQLQECYLQRELADKKDLVQKAIEGKPVAVICDEMSDDIGRFVLNILVAPMVPDSDGKIKSYLLDTVFLPKTNHAEVSGAVITTLVNWKVKFQDVITFNTDNAAYMKKAFREVIKGVMPNCSHVTCLAHIMNLLGESFRKPFEQTNQYVKSANAIFWHAGARKARYIRYLKESDPKKTPKLAPNPVGTRWNCWYDAVEYHRENMDVFLGFIETEVAHSKVPCDSLQYLAGLSADIRLQVKAEMDFISEKCQAFVHATDLFQSQSTVAVKAWSKLESLQLSFGSCGVSLREASRYFHEDLPSNDKFALQDRYCQAVSAVSQKLDKYMTPDGQPAVEFLQQIQFFDPTRLVTFDFEIDRLRSALPGLSAVPESEFDWYRKTVGPQAIKVSGGLPVDLTIFWNSKADELPQLSKCARMYIYALVNSADAERSFSLYNLVFSERRRSLSEDSLKGLVFMFYNNFIDSLL